MSEQPDTPEGEQHPEEPATVAEPAPATETLSAPAGETLSPPEPAAVLPPPPVVPSPAVAAAAEFDRPENASDRPEIQIGAAFAGGFVLALILKRLAR